MGFSWELHYRSVGSCAWVMADNRETKGLITPPPRWVSAQLLCVWVSARQQSWGCIQNLRRLLSSHWLPLLICCCALTQTCNNCGETHFGGGVTSAFVFPWTTVAWAPDSTFVGGTDLWQGPQRFWVHCHDYRCALTLAETLPGGEVVSTVIIVCLPSGCHCLFDSNSTIVMWHTLFWMSRKLAAAFKRGLSTSW